MVRRLIKRFRFHDTLHGPMIVLGVLGFLTLGILCFLWIGIPQKPNPHLRAGVTFSVPYAQELGLNWREVLTASLDDLGIRYFRIPAYWSLIEAKKGAYDWSMVDYQLDEIAKRNGHVTLAIGAKLPRWPECWIPDWALQGGRGGEESARFAYLQAVVERYRHHQAVSAWQVENEALFHFGVCPKPDANLLKREIAFVRELDRGEHPITTTDSGELSSWVRVGSMVDALGVSTYRVVRTFWGAIWEYRFIPNYWYARRALLIRAIVKDVYVSEFQMEPWTTQGILETPILEQTAFFSPERMQAHFDYAERMEFSSVSFWGIEWWWWMKTQQNDSRYWDIARTFFHAHTDAF